jgi:hypothetical protein
MTHAWDNDTNTKWFCVTALPWTAYLFAGGVTHVLTSYTVTSGNDAVARSQELAPRGLE